MFLLISLAAHHGESDPELMVWIKYLLDQMFGPGPWVVVLLLGALMVGLPLAVALTYLLRRKERGFLPPIHSGDDNAQPCSVARATTRERPEGTEKGPI